MRVIRLLMMALLMVALAGSIHPSLADSKPAPKITVLISQEAPPYEDALRGFKDYLQSQGMEPVYTIVRLHGEASSTGDTVANAAREKMDLLVTLGSAATAAALRQNDIKNPILASLILSTRELSHASNATGVALEFPMELEFQWLRRFMPDRKNVAVLYNSQENQWRVEQAMALAKKFDLNFMARKVDTPRVLPAELEAIERRADVLLGIADQVVMTAQTAKPILLFSFRNRIPLVGLSSAWVKAGALYALDRDYKDIGAQTGEMAVKILRGTAISALPPASPRKVNYSINLKTVRHMKLDLPQDLIDGAVTVIE